MTPETKSIAAFLLIASLSLSLPVNARLVSGVQTPPRVCAFVWPSCHDDSIAHRLIWSEGMGEWEIINKATPHFEGHRQPKRPLWGCLMDNDPKTAEKWINTAISHGVNTFVYDWYWYDGKPFLEGALDDGFLKAPSCEKMDFYVMWANHDVKADYWNCYKNAGDKSLLFRGKVTEQQFRDLVHRVIRLYFSKPNYVKIDGKPVFMIYDVDKFVESFDGDFEKASKALYWFRSECVKAGFKGLYLQCSLWSDAIYKDPKYSEKTGKYIETLGFDGVATYNMAGRDMDYSVFCEKGVRAWDMWKEMIGNVDYYPTVSIGYDDTPRYPAKGKNDVVQYNRTPEVFKATLNKAKDYAARNSKNIVYINAWNEWVEDSYLLPDEVHGYSYLNAVKDVFGPYTKDSLAVGNVIGVDFACPPRGQVIENQILNNQYLKSRLKFVRSSSKAALVISIDPSLAPEEYNINISTNGITLQGGSDAGVYWGGQRLSFILAAAHNGKIECGVIREKPEFGYRGALLDCARHFFSVDEVKRFIDIIALHRMNCFHWHLCDDQGWRIEIKAYPRLTEYGSIRKETLIGDHRHSNEYDGTPYGGFYTQDQIREIVAYAADRHVTIIPEIDIPGHGQAAMASYPELACEGVSYDVGTRWGVSTASLCIGKQTTFDFLKTVLDEVCDLFPGPYVNIGGDEVRTDNWKQCPCCQKAMKEHGFTNESELQGLIMQEMEQHLLAKGKRIIGWDEILDFPVSDSAITLSWRGNVTGKKSAKMGRDVIMASYTHFYLDYYQTLEPMANGEPFGFGEKLPLSRVVTFDPYEDLETPEERSHVLGIQANLWTEYIGEFSKVEHFFLPRYAAVSEIAWNGRCRPYEVFVEYLKKEVLPIYDYYGFNYGKYEF